ncbi:MAG: T9SS type A sorting domain-containing protein, partial [Chitinophagales bacterium]
VDLTDFFNDWVFQPGWADYALDSMTIQPLANGQFDVRVFIRQGLRAANHFHHNTPLQVDFRKPDGSFETKQLVVAGEKGIGAFQLSYAPIYCAVNRSHSLNLGQVTYEKAIKTPGTYGAQNTLLSLNVKNVPANDSAWVWVAHHWSAPEKTPALPSTVRISQRHYWTVEGNWPSGYVANGIFRFDNGIQNAELDADVAPSGVHEDSLLLLYRPGAGHEWIRFPRVKLFTVGSAVDGFGLLRADTMWAGEYAIASGFMDFSVSASEPVSTLIELQVSPNPVQDQLLVQWDPSLETVQWIELVDLQGKLIRSESNPKGKTQWSLSNLPSGTYLVRLLAADQSLLGINKVLKL